MKEKREKREKKEKKEKKGPKKLLSIFDKMLTIILLHFYIFRLFVQLYESEFRLQFKNILQHFTVEYGFFHPCF